MTHRPRPVHYRTILEVLNTRPVQFVIGLVFTILGIAMTILFTTLFTTVDSDVPQVDYAQVIARGQPAIGTITSTGVGAGTGPGVAGGWELGGAET